MSSNPTASNFTASNPGEQSADSPPPLQVQIRRMRHRLDAVSTAVDQMKDSTAKDAEVRLTMLEAEIQECRALGARVAEIADVVVELLGHLARQQDPEFTSIVDRYLDQL